MNLSKWWVAGVLLVAGVSAYIGNAVWQQHKSQQGLVLTECQIEEVVPTYIHFFVTNDVLQVMTKEQVKQRIEKIIQSANTVLKNSCIPLQRQIKSIQYVDFSEQYLFDFGSVHFALQKAVGTQVIGRIRQTMNEFYAILLGPDNTIFDDQWRGTSEMSPEGRFIAMSYDAMPLTFEHEMGHLAGADHDQQTIDEQAAFGFEQIVPLWDQKQSKPYARAALCGDAGTVMSYNQNILPVYSHPGLYYQGEQCGDPEHADNARVLRRYAKHLKQELIAGHWIADR